MREGGVSCWLGIGNKDNFDDVSPPICSQVEVYLGDEVEVALVDLEEVLLDMQVEVVLIVRARGDWE